MSDDREGLDAAAGPIRRALLSWYRASARVMPWRSSSDPYFIWLSEVMLQQTRVDQAMPYYERFVSAFPTVAALALAGMDDVLRNWEGLGYYSRARNLHAAARQIVAKHEGRIPRSYESMLELPGVGPYTAAAVASIAFGEHHAVLDGNVMRVLTRMFAISDDIQSARTRRRLQALVDILLDPEKPGDFNQAMMELGATVCTPRSPNCTACPLDGSCIASKEGRQDSFPHKKKKNAIPHYDVAAGIVLNADGDVFIVRRPEDTMLGGLWTFPGGRREGDESLSETCGRVLTHTFGLHVDVGSLVHRLTHAYSHFKITLHAFQCRLRHPPEAVPPSVTYRWMAAGRLHEVAFDRASRRLGNYLLREAAWPH